METAWKANTKVDLYFNLARHLHSLLFSSGLVWIDEHSSRAERVAKLRIPAESFANKAAERVPEIGYRHRGKRIFLTGRLVV